MKKYIHIICVAAMLFSLCFAGCSAPHEHVWKAATCSEPQTCRECGATNGSPLGHRWVEASCLAPATCARCGLTDGEPLPHDMTEATYWERPVCRVCGTASGEPLKPDFEQYAFTLFTTPLTPFDYVTSCEYLPDLKTTATGNVVYAGPISQEAKNSLGLQELEGYTWYAIQSEYVFSDQNAQLNSMSVKWTVDDYYDIVYADKSCVTDESTGITTFSCHWKDGDYTQCQRIIPRASFSLWLNNTCTFYLDVLVRIPTGYDGVCIAPIDPAVEWPEGMYCCDVLDFRNVVYFRFVPNG